MTVSLCCILLQREFPERISLCFYCTTKVTSLKYCNTKSSRKFKEYKRFGYFLKYSCGQENIRESSKSYDHRK